MHFLVPLLTLFSLAAIAAGEEDCRLALVESVRGSASLITPLGDKRDLGKTAALAPGDFLRTESGATADLRLCDGTGLRLGERAKFYFETADKDETSSFRLVRGTLYAKLAPRNGSGRIQLRIRTTTAAVGAFAGELVVDADDGGDRETAVHALEGEVLLGAEPGYDRLGDLREGEERAEYETLTTEKLSVIARNEAKPLAAAAYKLWEFRAERKDLFARALDVKGRAELAPRFLAAAAERKASRETRPLFERTREKVEEYVQESRPDRAILRQEAVAQPEAVALPAEPDAHGARRRQTLAEELAVNKQEAMDKRLRKGWRKNLDGKTISPRFPELNSR
jgi:hypothetical protein